MIDAFRFHALWRSRRAVRTDFVGVEFNDKATKATVAE
jgi:hypothetical protein